MKINDVVDYVRVTIDDLLEDRITNGLLVEYTEDSINMIQDTFFEFFYETSYKKLWGNSTVFPYPSDMKDSLLSEFLVKASGGEVASVELNTSATGSITVAYLEPIETEWDFIYDGSASSVSLVVDESAKEITMNYNDGTTTNAAMVAAMNASVLFREYFQEATTNQPSETMLSDLPTVNFDGGSGGGWAKCFELPQKEELSVMNNPLKAPRLDLQQYYKVVTNLDGNKVVRLLPDTITYYEIQYIARVDTSDHEAELNFPEELKPLVYSDVLLKTYTKLMNLKSTETERAVYMDRVKLIKSQYADYVRGLGMKRAGLSHTLKTE